VKGATEIGASERHSEGQAETRLVQLIDGDDREWSRLRLLCTPRWIGVSPVHIALLGPGAYHSGVEASKEDSISRLSAR
jgi:hypothetical protein